ncbi:MAG: efflux RND transporter periplasmic adaptor subunit, partial [Sedimentisphaerales bacterium]|nr:efflux RND transporter periplasmic adaptor subunit [Sedimentisphaerales bacterium]
PVNQGDHMVSLYSPALISAQEELLQALQTLKQIESSQVQILRETAGATVRASREKLRLWGLTPRQIEDIEARGEPLDHMTIYAPMGGVVVHKNAQEGMYVQEGTRIYTIADLAQVWVQLEAYESDLMWLRYGQKVEFTAESYPGRAFAGTISFIDPIVHDPTRVIKVRLDAPNPDMILKPGMFVRAVVRARIATAGRVVETALAGKWICPMHPGVVKDRPGSCDLCGMDLVQTESLGYVGVDTAGADAPLVVPASAVLQTGTRAVVYVRIPHADTPTFVGRQIELGPRAGDYFLVRSGLEEGELVVVKGNFKLDAELQIRARPSMMSPATPPEDAHDH